MSDVHSISDIQSETGGIDSDDYMMYDLCTCGSSGRAHKRDFQEASFATVSW